MFGQPIECESTALHVRRTPYEPFVYKWQSICFIDSGSSLRCCTWYSRKSVQIKRWYTLVSMTFNLFLFLVRKIQLSFTDDSKLIRPWYGLSKDLSGDITARRHTHIHTLTCALRLDILLVEPSSVRDIRFLHIILSKRARSEKRKDGEKRCAQKIPATKAYGDVCVAWPEIHQILTAEPTKCTMRKDSVQQQQRGIRKKKSRPENRLEENFTVSASHGRALLFI